MNDQKQVADILRVEGIMAQGYGMNPKIVMRDRRLSIEARSIYSYFSSFAGGGNQAFPSRDIMIADLGISANRYYKHLKQLVDLDYIRIERTQVKGQIYGKNIYTLVALPNPSEPQMKEKKEDVDLSATKSGAVDQKQGKSAGKRSIARLNVKIKSSVKELRERLDIDTIQKQVPEKSDLIEDIFMAIDDMASSEQITISGNVKKRDAITELLDKLTPDHIRLVADNVSANNQKIINRKAYLQACVVNSIFDIKKNNEEAVYAVEQKKLEEQQEEEREKMKKVELQNQYRAVPELKLIDEKLLDLSKNMSKSILSGNEVQHSRLKLEYSELQSKRDQLIKESGLEGCN